MPTARLIPSTYEVSSTNLSVSSASSMYDDTDSTDYATITNTRSGTTSYYLYIRGFNFDDIPSGAVVSSFTVKLKARESGISTSSSYAPKLAHGTSQLTSTCSAISTTATVLTFSGLDVDWDDIVGYGSTFGIRINCRRASRNTTGYMYVYGAEIEVTYSVPNPRTITSSLTGDGTISPQGAITTYDGEEYVLTITPANTAENVSITHDGADVTEQLVAHGQGGTVSTVLGAYELISGSFNGSGASYFSGIVGNGYDTADTTTSNYYSGGSSVQAVFQYDMGIDLPSNANITRCYVMVNGHAESSSNSSEYMCFQLKSGNTELSDEINFKSVSTSNTTYTLECHTLPTVSQLADMVLECTLGYYGGAINGATLFVEYDTASANPSYYTYTFTVDGDAVIAVVIGSANQLFLRLNGAWVAVTAVYKKVNGAWVEQTDLPTILGQRNYVKRS